MANEKSYNKTIINEMYILYFKVTLHNVIISAFNRNYIYIL